MSVSDTFLIITHITGILLRNIVLTHAIAQGVTRTQTHTQGYQYTSPLLNYAAGTMDLKIRKRFHLTHEYSHAGVKGLESSSHGAQAS